MRKRHPSVAAFEDEMTRSSPPDLAANRRLFEAMYRYAVGLGVFPLRDPLEGIEVDVRLAKALHVRSNPRPDRASA